MRDQQQSIAEFYDSLRADYKAAKISRFQRRRTGFSVMGSSSDYHIRKERDFLYILELARDLERNDTILAQGLRRLVSNIIQEGFTPDPETGDTEIDKDLKEMWREWAEERDIVTMDGEKSFHQVEELALYQSLFDGDICAYLPDGQSMEFFEAHRLRTPKTTKNVVHGVLLDRFRNRREYWFTADDIDPLKSAHSLRVKDMRPIKARDSDGNRRVLHIFNPRRFTMTRGITCFQPVIDVIGMLDDVQFARLVQQQAVSAWCILRETQPEFKGTRQAECETATAASTLPTTLEGTVKGIAAGLEVQAEPGEHITGFSPNVPSPQFFEHANMLMMLVAINLDMPLAMFVLDPSMTNFSGWRGAIDQSRLRFRLWQNWYHTIFHREVYKWKMRQWIDGDRALEASSNRVGISILKHKWNTPRWPYIEPLKDASADLLRDRNALTSKRRLHAQQGIDWEDLSTEIVDDNRLAITKAKKAAAELNKEFPKDDPVHWRELLSLPTPEGLSVNVNSEDTSNEERAK